MRPLLLLPLLCLLAFPPAIAGQQDDAATIDTAADANAGEADAEAAAVDGEAVAGPRSGFGQVMSVLTGLLQDAAQRETTGRGDGFALDNPAIEISVTPVEGQTSLRRASTRRHAAGDAPRGKRQQQLAGGAPR